MERKPLIDMNKHSIKIKPYRGDKLCDAVVGQNPNSRSPQLLRCKNKAEFLYSDSSKFGFPALLCKDCCDKISAKDRV